MYVWLYCRNHQKKTYLIKKEELLISKNLAIREIKAFDFRRKAFDL